MRNNEVFAKIKYTLFVTLKIACEFSLILYITLF